jgi:UDP-N-acetylmuramoylalanine--D-glutamate ligase
MSRRMPDTRIEVAAFDSPPSEEALRALGDHRPDVVLAANAVEALERCRVLVRSPGVSIHRPELIALRERGVLVTTATSLWMAERGGQAVIGVTGTKGKSTTASLISHMAAAGGSDVDLAGNIGLPALELLDADVGRWAVVELSSYQIADLHTGPEVAVFINLYPEHADWHGSGEAYRAEKLRLLSLPEVRTAVLPARQPELAAARSSGESLLFGSPDGWDASPEGVRRGSQLWLAQADLPLPGEHNALNLCAALTALEAAPLPLPEAATALKGFEGLPHRLQTIAERSGVRWVDDSISTTPESTLVALASFPGVPLVVLAGGQDRGQQHGALAAELVRRQAVLIGLPTTGEELLKDARAAGLPGERALAAEDLAEAVALARGLAVPGAVVLLSPAAPSYDHYTDFQERGERFRALVEHG